MIKILGAFILLVSLVSLSHAYTAVTLSTGVPTSVEKEFLKDTTTQFDSVLTVNPLASNTYAIKLFGVKSKPSPDVVTIDTTAWANNIQAMQNLLPVMSSQSYVNGWANGMQYDRASNMNLLGDIGAMCASSTTFIVDGSTWNTVYVDKKTCDAVINYSWQQFYQLNFATPTVLNLFDYKFEDYVPQ